LLLDTFPQGKALKIVFARTTQEDEAIPAMQFNYAATHKYSRMPFVSFDKLIPSLGQVTNGYL